MESRGLFVEAELDRLLELGFGLSGFLSVEVDVNEDCERYYECREKAYQFRYLRYFFLRPAAMAAVVGALTFILNLSRADFKDLFAPFFYEIDFYGHFG
jgi:hypothetical protein